MKTGWDENCKADVYIVSEAIGGNGEVQGGRRATSKERRPNCLSGASLM